MEKELTKEEFIIKELEELNRLLIEYADKHHHEFNKKDKKLMQKLYRQVSELAENFSELFKQDYRF